MDVGSQEIEGLRSLGVEVLDVGYRKLYPEWLYPGRSQFGELDPHPATLSVMHGYDPRHWIRVSRLLHEFAPEIVFFQWWHTVLAPGIGWLVRSLRRRDIKSAALLHHVYPTYNRHFMDLHMARWALKPVDFLIAHSSEVSRIAREAWPDKPLTVVPLPIDSRLRVPTNCSIRSELGIDGPMLLAFGLQRHYKGTDLAVRAMDLVTQEATLVVAGEAFGSFGDELRGLIASRSNVVWLDEFVSDELAACLFEAADALLLPYRRTTQSAVLEWGVRHRVPVVASGIGDLRETLDRYRIGVLHHTEDVEDLARAINTVLSHDRSQYEDGFAALAQARSPSSVAWGILHGVAGARNAGH